MCSPADQNCRVSPGIRDKLVEMGAKGDRIDVVANPLDIDQLFATGSQSSARSFSSSGALLIISTPISPSRRLGYLWIAATMFGSASSALGPKRPDFANWSPSYSSINE